ncbi:hypothetical protein Taro_050978, partial [Colocasia esculenta]|nr:hypothetical protein [Colocasia esculenta]
MCPEKFSFLSFSRSVLTHRQTMSTPLASTVLTASWDSHLVSTHRWTVSTPLLPRGRHCHIQKAGTLCSKLATNYERGLELSSKEGPRLSPAPNRSQDTVLGPVQPGYNTIIVGADFTDYDVDGRHFASHMTPMLTYQALEALRSDKRRKSDDLEAEWHRWFDLEDLTIAFSRLFWDGNLTWPLEVAELVEPPSAITSKHQLLGDSEDIGEPDMLYENNSTVDKL